MSGVETIPESAITGLEGLNPLSDRPVSLSMLPHGDLTPLADKQVSQWSMLLPIVSSSLPRVISSRVKEPGQWFHHIRDMLWRT
jgi:hypothetical protein